jgi:hypothetical protein
VASAEDPSENLTDEAWSVLASCIAAWSLVSFGRRTFYFSLGLYLHLGAVDLSFGLNLYLVAVDLCLYLRSVGFSTGLNLSFGVLCFGGVRNLP